VALPGWYVTQTGCGDVLVFKGKRTDVARPNVRGTRMSSVMIQRICPAESKDYLISQLAGLEHEVFACLFLDYRHRVIEFRQLFGGTIDGCSVRPREVVKTALLLNAAAVVFAHNHPSGVPEPSPAEQTLTRRLQDALALVRVRGLDHLDRNAPATVPASSRQPRAPPRTVLFDTL
jgi:DNA repair protein RadC